MICWADDVRTVALMEAALAAYAPSLQAGYRPLEVLVEVGGQNGRTGARDVETAVEVARAIATAPHLRLLGIGGYEGAIAHGSDDDSLASVRAFLGSVRATYERVAGAGLFEDGLVPVVTAGGSAYFDDVAEVLGPLTDQGVRVVLRSRRLPRPRRRPLPPSQPAGRASAHRRGRPGQRDPRLGAGRQPARTRTGPGRRREA